MTPAVTGYFWCAMAALASAGATFLIKVSNQHGADWNIVRLAWLGGAATTYAIGFVCYSVALQRLEMSLAYPVMTGFAMAMVAAIGFAALDEQLTMSKIIGMVLIALGAVFLSR